MKHVITTWLLATTFCLNASASTQKPFDMDSMSVKLQARAQPTKHLEQAPVHFSFSENGEVWKEQKTNPVHIASDEYWMQVSGAQLKQGVDLDITIPEAIVRFSALTPPAPAGRNSSPLSRQALQRQRALPLDPDQLVLFRKGNRLKSAKRSIVPEEKLAVSGIFQKTSAMRLKKQIGVGRFTIRSTQNLIDSDQYMVNVKEKGSDKVLNLTAPRLALLNSEILNFKASLRKSGKRVSKAKYQAYLKSPSGQKIKLTLKGGAKKGWWIQLPNSLQPSQPGVLHELYIMANAGAGEARLKRAGKLAFSLATPTAQLEKFVPLVIDDIAAEATLNVASPGRYELRGTLYGTDETGHLRSIMRSHSAYWLEPGQHTIPLKLDPAILEASGLYAPFKVMNVELMDQNQFALLHRQESVN